MESHYQHLKQGARHLGWAVRSTVRPCYHPATFVRMRGSYEALHFTTTASCGWFAGGPLWRRRRAAAIGRLDDDGGKELSGCVDPRPAETGDIRLRHERAPALELHS